MSFDPSADLGVFINQEEFATAVTLWPGEERTRSIGGVFSETPVEGKVGGAKLSTTRPVLLCLSSDVAEAGQGTPVFIPANARLSVKEGSYTVSERRPAGPGLTLLVLAVRR
ncbi:MAG: hypothetical protein V1797_20845 [Pseudomonadota bacterium]